MKPKPYLSFILAGIIVFLLFLRFCEKPEVKTSMPVLINTDSIKAIGQEQERELQMLHKITEQAEKTVTVAVERWHKAKHDTIGVPYLKVINECDSMETAYKKLDSTKTAELNQAYCVIETQKTINSADSTNHFRIVEHKNNVIDSLTNSNSKFWKGFKIGFIAGNVTGAVGVGVVRR